MKGWVSFFWIAISVSSLQAVQYGETLDDPLLAARAARLYTLIRCPVCAGQSLDASQALLAQEMRADIRRLLMAGKSDLEIVNHFKAQYGNDVSFDPAVCLQTLMLWGLPFLLLGIGIITLIRRYLQNASDIISNENKNI